jgi:predicted CoA-binding protein
MSSRQSVEAFVGTPAIALLGMSRSGKKFGNFAYRELTDRGYRIYPIHPSVDLIGGVRCYRDFDALPERVEAALLVTSPAQAIGAIRQAVASGVSRIWLQQGAESPEVLETCRELGLDTVSGECILMFAKPKSYHKVHRWLWGLLGKLPA